MFQNGEVQGAQGDHMIFGFDYIKKRYFNG